MDENKKRLLEAAGVDIEDALSRFMNNEALMIRMLLRFAEDKNFFPSAAGDGRKGRFRGI